MAEIDMARVARQIGIKNGYFLTRDKGESAYELIKQELQSTPEANPLILDFPSDQLVDSSFADESAVRLSEEVLRGKHGDRCLLLKGLTADSIKNFEAVLSLRGIKLPLLVVETGGECRVIGSLEESLRDTLTLVHEFGRLTAAALVSQLGLAVNTASTRLKRLHNLHLVRRESEVSERGLQYIYYGWLAESSNEFWSEGEVIAMAKYYVNKNAQNNGDHEVHVPSCSFFPDPENRVYLGEFATCRAAVTEAKKHYAQTNGCYYCSNECHTG